MVINIVRFSIFTILYKTLTLSIASFMKKKFKGIKYHIFLISTYFILKILISIYQTIYPVQSLSQC